MKKAGAHVSIAGGLFHAPDEAKELGAGAFGMFVKNQRQWFAPLPDDNAVNWFRFHLASSRIRPEDVLVHGGYLINLGNADQERFQKSFDSGAHVNLSTPKEAAARIAAAVNRAAEETESVVFVLETMAGQGTVIGSRFEELAEILSQMKNPSRAGVCIDTCHIFSAGYDLRTEEGFEKTMEEFDRLIGFPFLKGMHLNDSKNPLNSRCDRHESLGKGHLGLFPFEKIASDKRFDNIPLILETPDRELWRDEIRFLCEKAAVGK